MRRLLALAIVLVMLLAGSVFLLRSRQADSPAGPATQELIAAIRSEPRTFNRYVARDRASHLVSVLTQARLVRIRLDTQEAEPWLASRYEVADEGKTLRLTLREGVTWSDGTPFTSADVAFSFRAALDPRTGSTIADSLMVGGKPVVCEVVDPHTLILRYAEPTAAAPRLLDVLPIVPAHVLAASLEAGTFREQWAVTTPPSQIVGLGPFLLESYAPGDRLVFVRNPRYFRTGLPKLDRITVHIVPDQNAEFLQVSNGGLDVMTGDLRPDDLDAARTAAQAGVVRLHDAGVGLDPDMLWFNLKAEKDGGAAGWKRRDELRAALSMAIDRTAMANAVYQGQGVPVDGYVTPGNKEWFDRERPMTPFDLGKAGTLLDTLGLRDRNGDGLRDAPDGKTARVTVLTQKGNAARERGAAFLQQAVKAVGLTMDVVPLEQGALIEAITTGKFEAAFFGALGSDTDPASQVNFWLSSGSFHPWNPAQATPATPWEAEIDRLMLLQARTLDREVRRKVFADVQRTFAAAQPAVFFAAPKVTVATSARLAGVQPGILQPSVLWNADSLAIESK